MANMIISKITAESNYKIAQFTETEIAEVEKLISLRQDKNGKESYSIRCQIRDKEIKLTDEELVRQLYLNKLINTYHYPKDKMELEYCVSFGREKKASGYCYF